MALSRNKRFEKKIKGTTPYKNVYMEMPAKRNQILGVLLLIVITLGTYIFLVRLC